eukprot:COSAG06_NODE_152_length_21942_cov_4.593234_16_plen_81_part_00
MNPPGKLNEVYMFVYCTYIKQRSVTVRRQRSRARRRRRQQLLGKGGRSMRGVWRVERKAAIAVAHERRPLAVIYRYMLLM